jgi:hypothetical protein
MYRLLFSYQSWLTKERLLNLESRYPGETCLGLRRVKPVINILKKRAFLLSNPVRKSTDVRLVLKPQTFDMHSITCTTRIFL